MNTQTILPSYLSIHKKAFFLLWVVLGFMFTPGAYSQSAELTISPDSIAPGMHSSLGLKVTAPHDYQIIFPVISDTLTADIEIVSYGQTDTLEVEESVVYTLNYKVTAWQEGFFAIPPVVFQAIHQGDTVAFESNPSLLEVSAVDVDMEAGLKDIRPIFRVPVTFSELLPYILALLVVIGASILIYRMIRKRNRKDEKTDLWEKPDIPAHVAALSSLEKLRNQHLWENGRVKQYHTELTLILRMYLEKRYHIDAPEMTTSEIIASLNTHISNRDMLSILKGILEQADLVKFARHAPEGSENQAALEMAIEFVKYNIPQQEEAAGQQVISNPVEDVSSAQEVEGSVTDKNKDQ